jgi:PEP-CTERM motif
MMNLKSLLLGAAATALVVAGSAHAALITSSAGLTLTAFPLDNYFGAGPITFGAITWSSTNASNQDGSVFGYNGGYGFGSNGFSSSVLTGVNDNFGFYGVSDTMTFAFSSPVQAVGAVLNWYPDAGDTAYISAYDASNNLLDTYTVLSTGTNVGTPNSFYGFWESTADIAKFTMTDGYIAAIGGIYSSAVPEPSTWAMMGLGFAGLAFAGYRSRRTAISIA